jgi:hypothetical protein
MPAWISLSFSGRIHFRINKHEMMLATRGIARNWMRRFDFIDLMFILALKEYHGSLWLWACMKGSGIRFFWYIIIMLDFYFEICSGY